MIAAKGPVWQAAARHRLADPGAPADDVIDVALPSWVASWAPGATSQDFGFCAKGTARLTQPEAGQGRRRRRSRGQPLAARAATGA
jgi:hypothetical protein